jgi:hypothetical protein
MMKHVFVVSIIALAVPVVYSFSHSASVSFGIKIPSVNAQSSMLSLRMSSKGGFGKPPPEKKLSKLAEDRGAAAERYENIKASGSPEFSVFFRSKGAGDEDGMVKGGWYPVGSITCPSSQLVGKAIFNTEDALLQGAFRVHSKQIKAQLKTRDGKTIGKWQDMKECDLEYGFQLKEFPDEEVKVAEKPREKSDIEQAFGNVFQKVQDAVNWVPDQ